MFVARFSYDIAPADRDVAIQLIEQEIQAASRQGMAGRLLVPITRGMGTAALQFEVQLRSLDDLERLRHAGFGSERSTAEWVSQLVAVLKTPPCVEILRVASLPDRLPSRSV